MANVQLFPNIEHKNLLNCLNRSKNEDWNARTMCASQPNISVCVNKYDRNACTTNEKETGKHFVLYTQSERFTFKRSYREKWIVVVAFIFISVCSFFTQPIWWMFMKHEYRWVIYSTPFNNSFVRSFGRFSCHLCCSFECFGFSTNIIIALFECRFNTNALPSAKYFEHIWLKNATKSLLY